MSVIVRQYGLLAPLNWGEDCFEHLFLQSKFWNRLVEIERASRDRYRGIIGSDEKVNALQTKIDGIKARIAELDAQRKEARKQHRAKIGAHTAIFDNAIKVAKEEIKTLAVETKAARADAKEAMKALTAEIEPARKEEVKSAYQASGLWWGNYNAVVDSYNRARIKAMKEGADLNFHRFDGTGRFTCQIQGGMSTEDLLSARQNIAQVRLISSGEFAEAIGSNPPALFLQSVGSRRDERQYGILTLTIYTGKNEQEEKFRRTLDFPVILHRPLPADATLKTLVVNRKKVGTDFLWSVTFTFTADQPEIENPSPSVCGINLGWKQVKGGLRIATAYDGQGASRHIVLSQVIVDKLEYADVDLKSRIDSATNENWRWLLKQMDKNVPEQLAEEVTALRRAKKPHPAKYARFVIKWREIAPDFEPSLLPEAEVRRKKVKRLSLEYSHLRDKVLRHRLDFYRKETKKIADLYGRIVLDKMDLRAAAKLENAGGAPNELKEKARRLRTIAAVSEFREWLSKQGAKSGAEIVAHGMESTQTCHKCGGRMEPTNGLVRRCCSCQELIDQDENAAANLYQFGVNYPPTTAAANQ